MQVLVGSINPVKIEAARQAFGHYFQPLEVQGHKVKSGVPDQPFGEQTFTGARTRALKLKQIAVSQELDPGFFVGLEGGVQRLYNRWFVFGVACVLDGSNRAGYGLAPGFELPGSLARPLVDGTELGELMQRVSGQRDIRSQQGAIGFFSQGMIKRQDLYVSGLITALVPFLNPGLYGHGDLYPGD